MKFANPKPDLHNINAVLHRCCVTQHWYCGELVWNSVTPSLVKIHWHLLKLSSRNENMNRLQEDRQTDTWTTSVIPYYPDTIVWRGINSCCFDKKIFNIILLHAHVPYVCTSLQSIRLLQWILSNKLISQLACTTINFIYIHAKATFQEQQRK